MQYSRRQYVKTAGVVAVLLAAIAGGSTFGVITGTLRGGDRAARPGAVPRGALGPGTVLRGYGAAARPPAGGHDAGTWTAAPVYLGLPIGPRTVRDIVRTSIGGWDTRIRLSNEFGTAPVTFDDAEAGTQAAGAALVPGSNRPVTFGGARSVTIPPGAEVLSDPLPGYLPPRTNLAVSVHIARDAGLVTGHPQAQQLSFYSRPGDFAASASAAPFAFGTSSWYFLDGVEVDVPASAGTVIAFGDSITDGFRSATGADARWPDVLARRLLALPAGEQLGVANEGLSSNRVTVAGPGPFGGSAGPSAQARFASDVLGQPGATAVILLEGINDIGDHVATAAQLIAADKQLIAQAHAAGLRILGGTLLPFQGAGYYSAAGERIREQVNAWIRTSGAFDGVLDFDKALRDPADPLRLLPAYDSGDHLHPSDAGYQAMADAIPLSLLR
jgi:lysophospholipase L1-like esterase